MIKRVFLNAITSLFIASVFFSASNCVGNGKQAQQFDQSKNHKTEEPEISFPLDRIECEYIKLVLDNSVDKVRKSKTGYLILISRRGVMEKDQRLTRDRFRFIKGYLVFKGLPPERTILAEGDATKGLGEIDIYAEGKWIYKLLMKRNARSTCSPNAL